VAYIACAKIKTMLIAKQQPNRAGFTIVELLIVVVVIAILAAITIVSYNGIQKRAIISTLQSELSSSAKKLENVKIDSADSQYPSNFSTTGVVAREGVSRAYYKQGETYCLSLTQQNISYYIVANGSPKEGLCTAIGYGADTIFVFNTTLPSCGTTVQLPVAQPTSAAGSVIDWGDGTTGTLTAANQSHNYATEGTYTVRYTGPITNVYTGSGGVATANRGCLSSVEQWGSGIAVTRITLSDSIGLTSVAEPPLSVTNRSSMFSGATSFNQDISSWNTSNVTDMSNMFNGASAFNQSLNGWDTGNVTTMNYMFGFAAAFNKSISNWNTAKVTDMTQMFAFAGSFNQPIGGWNTANVTNMFGMFNQATAFNQPLDGWNTAKVTNMQLMFNYASAFNQPINSWNTANVTNMNSMFNAAVSFNQPLASWNTAKVTDMSYMFLSSFAYNQNLSSWNVGAVITKPPAGFSSGNTVWTLPKPQSGW